MLKNITKCNIPLHVVYLLYNYGKSMLQFMGHPSCHFAMIYTCSGKSITVYSYGHNHIRHKRPIHAEMDAINNLPPVSKKKKLVKVKLLVIRISKSKLTLMDSKCCVRCCEIIYKIPPLRGYTVENIAYSTESGSIEDYHPINLLLDDEYHTSFYYSKRNYKPKIREKAFANPSPRMQLFINKKNRYKYRI